MKYGLGFVVRVILRLGRHFRKFRMATATRSSPARFNESVRSVARANMNAWNNYVSHSNKFKDGAGDENRTRVLSLSTRCSSRIARRGLGFQPPDALAWGPRDTLATPHSDERVVPRTKALFYLDCDRCSDPDGSGHDHRHHDYDHADHAHRGYHLPRRGGSPPRNVPRM